MRKSRFTEAQIVTISREADKGPIDEVAKKHGVSEQSVYTWHKRFGVMDANEMAIITNPIPSKWASVFGNTKPPSVFLDRPAHHCHIQETVIRLTGSCKAVLQLTPRSRRARPRNSQHP